MNIEFEIFQIAESTPPPSPPSPTVDNTQPAASTTAESPSSSSPLPAATTPSVPQSNRFQKVITFQGHSLLAYICSGLDMTNQRECVSIRDLCHTLHPDPTMIEKIEKKMFRLLRNKNINRFRPQNQQAGCVTRLVDLKDIETHWDFIEKEISSVIKGN